MTRKKLNGFTLFGMEWKKENGLNMTMTQTTAAVSEIWNKLSAKEKESYKIRAKLLNSCNLKSTGLPIKKFEIEQKKKAALEVPMKVVLSETSELGLKENRLKEEKFHFIMVNHFTRLHSTKIYVPAEIAIVEFSLMDGVRRKYHTLVSPNIDLYGSAYDAMDYSDTTHHLPLPPKAMGEKDMMKIYSNICKFISDESNGLNRTLYTRNKDWECVQSALSYIIEECHSKDDVDIYSIEELFYTLKCATCDLTNTAKPASPLVCDSIFDQDIYEYASNIACEFHEQLDRSKYCALSQVCRWAFTFANCMCKDLSITIKPGYHGPPQSNTVIVIRGSKGETIDQKVSNISPAMLSLSTASEYSTYEDDPSSFISGQTKKTTGAKSRKPAMAQSTSITSVCVFETPDISHNPYFSIDYAANEKKVSDVEPPGAKLSEADSSGACLVRGRHISF